MVKQRYLMRYHCSSNVFYSHRLMFWVEMQTPSKPFRFSCFSLSVLNYNCYPYFLKWIIAFCRMPISCLMNVQLDSFMVMQVNLQVISQACVSITLHVSCLTNVHLEHLIVLQVISNIRSHRNMNYYHAYSLGVPCPATLLEL